MSAISQIPLCPIRSEATHQQRLGGVGRLLHFKTRAGTTGEKTGLNYSIHQTEQQAHITTLPTLQSR